MKSLQNLRRKPNRRDGKRDGGRSSSSSDVNSDFGTDEDHRYGGGFHDLHHQVISVWDYLILITHRESLLLSGLSD